MPAQQSPAERVQELSARLSTTCGHLASASANASAVTRIAGQPDRDEWALFGLFVAQPILLLLHDRSDSQLRPHESDHLQSVIALNHEFSALFVELLNHAGEPGDPRLKLRQSGLERRFLSRSEIHSALLIQSEASLDPA